MTKLSNACSTKPPLPTAERAGWEALLPLALPKKAAAGMAARDAAVVATEEAEDVEEAAAVVEEAD